MINKTHVFVVDEDPSVRKGLLRLLSNAGYSVSQFTSLNNFMDVIKPGLSGCILLDSTTLELSEMDLKAEFKKHGVCLPFFIISADDDSKIKQRAHKMKAAGFFRKPIDGLALVDSIDWAIQAGEGKK
jgi:FixJ family two-component response regulator